MIMDELAAAVVGVETDDLPELGRIHAGLLAVAEDERVHDEARRLARGAAEIVGTVILREAGDPAASMTDVGRKVSEIQRIRERLERGEDVDRTHVPPADDIHEDQPPQSPSEQDSSDTCVDSTQTVLNGDRELLSEFVTESLDHLERSEGALLDIETNPDDTEGINAVFRAFHTVKGTSGFLGLETINRVAHKAETLLDRARQGEIRLGCFRH